MKDADGPAEDRSTGEQRDGTDLGRRRRARSKGKETLEAAKKAWRIVLVAVLLASALLVLAFGIRTQVIDHTLIVPSPTPVISKVIIGPLPTVRTTAVGTMRPRPAPTVTRTVTPSPRPSPRPSPSPHPSPSPTCRIRVGGLCV